MSHQEKMMRAIGKLEGTVQTHIDQVDTYMAQNETDHTTMSKRLRGLEKKQSWILGAFAAVTGGAGYLMKGIIGG